MRERKDFAHGNVARAADCRTRTGAVGIAERDGDAFILQRERERRADDAAADDGYVCLFAHGWVVRNGVMRLCFDTQSMTKSIRNDI